MLECWQPGDLIHPAGPLEADGQYLVQAAKRRGSADLGGGRHCPGVEAAARQRED